MKIILFRSFHKRENSTKLPTQLNTDYELDGFLRENCSIIKPVVQFKRFPNDATPANIGYAQIPVFNRYYFVRDWVWVDGLWEAHMEVDTLASHRYNIGLTSAYIERTSNPSYQNGTIPDKQYPTKNYRVHRKLPFTPRWQKSGLSSANYFYVIGVVGSYASSAVGYYLMTKSQMGSLVSYLMSDDYYNDAGFGSSISQMTKDTAKSMYNPLQYITSCFLFPMDYNDFTLGTLTSINLGPFTIPGTRNLKGYYMGDMPILDFANTIDLSNAFHPQDNALSNPRGSYLNYAPYSRWTLFYPPFGTIPIDNTYFNLNNNINMNLHVYMDGATGKGRLIINALDPSDSSTFTVAEYTTLLAIPVELAQISIDYLQSATASISAGVGVATGLAGIATMNPILMGAGAAMALGSIGDALEASMPQMLSQGSYGSCIAFYGRPALNIQYTYVIDEDNDDLGRPSCIVSTIATVGSDASQNHYYVKCGEVHIDFICLDEEKSIITQHLLSGIFYE